MLTASDVMTTDVITVSPDTSVADIAKLLREKRISGVPVVNPDNTVVGIVSEGDLMSHAQVVGERRRSWWLRLFEHPNAIAHEYARAHGRVARDVMISPVVTVDPGASLAEIANTLENHRIKRVPVVRDGNLMGIVTRGNLLQAMATVEIAKAASVDDRAIREQIIRTLAAEPWANLNMKNIIVQDGVVHLWGFVENEEERHALRIVAENAPGTKSVEDHLQRYHIPSAYE
jgi:CBS-domain-containing membrane protein